MEPAREGLREKLQKIKFSDPAHPVISNVTAGPVSTGSQAQDLLVDQLTSPVRWRASVEHMVKSGVERFFELGPGSVLCGLNKRNARGFPCVSLGKPADFAVLGG
jgi:[acyl-carrier-protein] S-malonyltransferase